MTTFRRITIPEVKAACDQIGLRLKPGVTYGDGACCPIAALAVANGIEVDMDADPLLLADGLGYNYQYADSFIMGFDGCPAASSEGVAKSKQGQSARELGYSDGVAVRLALCPNEPLGYAGPLSDQDWDKLVEEIPSMKGLARDVLDKARAEWVAASDLATESWHAMYPAGLRGPINIGKRCDYIFNVARSDELWMKYCVLERKYKRENPDNQEGQAKQ